MSQESLSNPLSGCIAAIIALCQTHAQGSAIYQLAVDVQNGKRSIEDAQTFLQGQHCGKPRFSKAPAKITPFPGGSHE